MMKINQTKIEDALVDYLLKKVFTISVVSNSDDLVEVFEERLLW